MSFYSEFAGHYESIFPLEEDTYSFLRERAPVGARVLDMGCGTGDYCGRFADDGREAMGIDLDPEMVAVASRRFPGASFRVMDMKGVSALPGTFDCVYCIGNVISHLPEDGLPSLLADVHALLETSGSWVFQTVNWDYLLRLERFRFPDVVIPEEELVFEREYPLIRRSGTSFVTRLTRRGRALFEGAVVLHPVRASDYLAAHEAAGFGLRSHYSDFVGGEFAEDRMSASVFEFVRE